MQKGKIKDMGAHALGALWPLVKNNISCFFSVARIIEMSATMNCLYLT